MLYNFKSKWGRSIYPPPFFCSSFQKEMNSPKLSIWNIWIIDRTCQKEKFSNFVLATAYLVFFLWPSLMAWVLFGCKNQKAIWISLLEKGIGHTVGALPLRPSCDSSAVAWGPESLQVDTHRIFSSFSTTGCLPYLFRLLNTVLLLKLLGFCVCGLPESPSDPPRLCIMVPSRSLQVSVLNVCV